MKVLMLGWEFPPHISGGLGTACFGLTQGLAHHGVDVLFVVPRARGDEDQRFVKVLGANQVPIALQAVRDAGSQAIDEHEQRTTEERASFRRRASIPRASGAITSAAVVDDSVSRSFELIAIDSLLSPYITEADYVARLKEHGQGSLEHGAPSPGAQSAPRSPAAARARAAVAEMRAVLARHHELAHQTTRVEAEVRTHTPGESRTLEFSGAYGPDLMAEVARYALAVSQVARARDFDVIHCHDWMTLPAGLVAARVSGRKLVFHVHACEYDRSGESINERVRDIEQLGLDAADLVVCVSHYTAGILQQRYRVDPQKLRVVHNAVTHKQLTDQLHEEKHIDEPIVLFLGRVTFQKGPDYFLEAAARVIQVDPRVKFVMSGSGDMLPVMIERAARLGIARNIHFTGFLKGREVERMYAMADIYVMPSVSEPFGISPLEAMALDVPVIVSRQSGVSEVLRNALKVDFWDVQDMANKILALIRYPALGEQLTDEGWGEIQGMRWEVPAGLLRDVYNEVSA